jgi:hypothetical protein
VGSPGLGLSATLKNLLRTSKSRTCPAFFKSLIHEEFGDGIMSAIDFSMDIQRVEVPKGDRQAGLRNRRGLGRMDQTGLIARCLNRMALLFQDH